MFASLQGSMNVWSMPIDADSGRVTGALEKLTQGNSDASIPSISADGTKLVFVAGSFESAVGESTRYPNGQRNHSDHHGRAMVRGHALVRREML